MLPSAISDKKRHIRSKFTADEDNILRMLVMKFGEDWDEIAHHLPGRNRRQCRERYIFYLSPTINHDSWSDEEDQLILKLQAEWGSKWVKISKFFPARTEINVKNRWMVLNRRNKKNNRFCDTKPIPTPLIRPSDSLLTLTSHAMDDLEPFQIGTFTDSLFGIHDDDNMFNLP